MKPISRSKANALLEGVLERAEEFNNDPEKVIWIERIVLFGSLLDPDAADHGDVDLKVELSQKPSDDPAAAALDYARGSRRSFSSFIDRLLWPQQEARQTLKNKSPYISIHVEDVSRITERLRVVYERDPGASETSKTRN